MVILNKVLSTNGPRAWTRVKLPSNAQNRSPVPPAFASAVADTFALSFCVAFPVALGATILGASYGSSTHAVCNPSGFGWEGWLLNTNATKVRGPAINGRLLLTPLHL